jgi:hypothetical protein
MCKAEQDDFRLSKWRPPTPRGRRRTHWWYQTSWETQRCLPDSLELVVCPKFVWRPGSMRKWREQKRVLSMRCRLTGQPGAPGQDVDLETVVCLVDLRVMFSFSFPQPFFFSFFSFVACLRGMDYGRGPWPRPTRCFGIIATLVSVSASGFSGAASRHGCANQVLHRAPSARNAINMVLRVHAFLAGPSDGRSIYPDTPLVCSLMTPEICAHHRPIYSWTGPGVSVRTLTATWSSFVRPFPLAVTEMA